MVVEGLTAAKSWHRNGPSFVVVEGWAVLHGVRGLPVDVGRVCAVQLRVHADKLAHPRSRPRRRHCHVPVGSGADGKGRNEQSSHRCRLRGLVGVGTQSLLLCALSQASARCSITPWAAAMQCRRKEKIFFALV